MASGTLERCSLQGWILLFTVQGRWQTACMTLCGRAVCWCQHCGSRGPWWRWGYGMGRRMLWAMNTGAFYWWHWHAQRYRDEILRPIVVPFIHGHHLMLQHDNAQCTDVCCNDLYTVPGSWKHPSSYMASILTGQVTHWACLGCSGSVYTTACSSSCQHPATSHSHWRGVDQHYTGHNQQPYQLYVKEMCCTVWGKWWSHQILTGFSDPVLFMLKINMKWPISEHYIYQTCLNVLNQFYHHK